MDGEFVGSKVQNELHAAQTMTDYKKFVRLMEEFGIELKYASADDGGSLVRLEDGIGYSGFYWEIEFDASGKFVREGAWE